MGGRIALIGAGAVVALVAWRSAGPAPSVASDDQAPRHRAPSPAADARDSPTAVVPTVETSRAANADPSSPVAYSDRATPPLANRQERSTDASAIATGTQASEDIGRARALIAERQFSDADALLRRAWESPEHRAQAAADLWSLYRRPGFSIKADAEQVLHLLRRLGPEFRRHETPGFVVLSDAPARWVEERAAQLERARSDFFRVMKKMGVPARPHQRKLLCVLFDDPESYRRFAREEDGVTAEWVAGYYASRANRVVSYNDARDPTIEQARAQAEALLGRVAKWRSDAHEADRRGDAAGATRLRKAADDAEAEIKRATARVDAAARASASAKLVHEAVHLLAFNTGVQRPGREYPFWLTEGLATSFEGGAAGGGAGGPDRSAGLESRRRTVRDLAASGRLAPIEALVSVRGALAWSAAEAEAMYAQSAALFRLLYRRDPLALGQYLQALGDANGPSTPNDRLALFVEAFGSPASIDLASER